VIVPSDADTMIIDEDIAMTLSQTSAGTPVLDLDPIEYKGFLEDEVRSRMAMSVAEFTERYLANQLDDADPDVPFLVGLLWIGQNGRPAVAT
jgi:hypothetical protein